MNTEQILKQMLKRLANIEATLRTRQEQMLTTSQAAKMLGCTTAALRMRANRGLVNCTRSDTGRLLFKKSELLKLS